MKRQFFFGGLVWCRATCPGVDLPNVLGRKDALCFGGRAHLRVLAWWLFWLATTAFGADSLEMYLDGQLLRAAPETSTALLIETGSVGRIDLKIPDGGGFLGTTPGIASFANDRGSFAISASTSLAKTNTASLRWKREFTKLPDNVPFTYIVNPSVLYLIVPNADPTNHFLASWKLVVKVSGVEFMSSERVIEGLPRLSGPTAFGLTTNTGAD